MLAKSFYHELHNRDFVQKPLLVLYVLFADDLQSANLFGDLVNCLVNDSVVSLAEFLRMS